MRIEHIRIRFPLAMLSTSLLLYITVALFLPSADAIDVNVPDANLASALRGQLGIPSGDPITDTALASLTGEAYFSGRGIVDLTGLEYAVNLFGLGLSSNQISSLGPISGLSNLDGLDVSSNQLTSLSAISGLSKLTRLGASSNQISSIGSLPSSLQYLGLQDNQITSVSDLSGLTSLIELGLSGNQISSASGLSGLSKLQKLGLSSNQLTSVSGLPSGLYGLTVSSNQISDISPLSGFTNLVGLGLGSNQITDLSPLVANSGLGSGDSVDVSSNPLSADSLNIHIPALQARGVSVTFTDSNVPVEFATFHAEVLTKGVQLEWKTSSEIRNLGFHIYRGREQAGEYARITLDMISGQGADAGEHTYQFLDETAEPGATYWYRIEHIAFDGNSESSAPIEVVVTPKLTLDGKIATLWAKLKK